MDSEVGSSCWAGPFGPTPAGFEATSAGGGFSEGLRTGTSERRGLGRPPAGAENRRAIKVAPPPDSSSDSGSVRERPLSFPFLCFLGPFGPFFHLSFPFSFPLSPLPLSPRPFSEPRGVLAAFGVWSPRPFPFFSWSPLPFPDPPAAAFSSLLLPTLLCLVSLLPTVVTKDVTEGSS